jgi:hypothetical protein
LKLQLLLVSLPALTIVGVPLDASANLDVGSTLSGTIIKADSVGTLRTRTVMLHNHEPVGDADSTSDGGAPEIAYVTYTLTDFSGPAPLENPVTAPLVWEDSVTGARTFSSVIAFEDDAVDQAYTIVTTWYDAFGNPLGSAEEDVVVEGRGTAPVALDVLNPSTEAGDVVLLRGDLVQVNFAVLCDFPWLAADCSAQQAESSHKDRILLMTRAGEVISKTKRGQPLSGLVLLKAKTLAAEPLVVGYLRRDSGTVTDTSDAVITVVADPSTAALIARADALEARVAALEARLDEVSAGQDAQDAAIAANSAEQLRSWELILDLQAADTVLDGRVTANAGTGEANAAALDRHKQLTEPIWETFESQITHNAGGIAANAAELRAHKQLTEPIWETFESQITHNAGGIAANAAGIEAARPWWQQLQSATPLAETEARVAANESGIANNAAGIAANTQKHIDDGFLYESTIEDLEEFIGRTSAATVTNAGGIADALGASQANYEAILRDQATPLVGGETARMTFAHAGLSLTGQPVGDYQDADGGYRYIADASVVDLTGDTVDSPFEVGITLTGNLPGIVFEAGAEVVFPNVTSAPPGAQADLFSVGADGGTYLGRATVLGSGKFYAMLEGEMHLN